MAGILDVLKTTIDTKLDSAKKGSELPLSQICPDMSPECLKSAAESKDPAVSAKALFALDYMNNNKKATPEDIDAAFSEALSSEVYESGGEKWMQKVSKSIKKRGTEGAFREYCGGKVTMECIERGLKSPDPKVRKRAALAKAFLKVAKKELGGETGSENDISQYVPASVIDEMASNHVTEFFDKLGLSNAIKRYGGDVVFKKKKTSYYQEGGEMQGDTAGQEAPAQQPQEQQSQEGQQQDNQFGYDISFDQFVAFINQYPEYFKLLMQELQKGQ